VARLNASPIGYLHITEPINNVAKAPKKQLTKPSVATYFRKIYKGVIIGGVDYSRDSGNRAAEFRVEALNEAIRPCVWR
jgi:hypothetical protein